MKRFFLLIVLAACGSGTTTDNDAGNGDAGNDVVSKDSSPSDAAATDSSSNDSATGDGGTLGQGQHCDPQSNECQPNLLCCSEPTHMPDAATAYFCETPDNTNQCPKLP